MKRIAASLVLGAGLVLGAAVVVAQPAAKPSPAAKHGVMRHATKPAEAAVFTLTSTAFKDNGVLAQKFTCNNKANPNCFGENISPPLAWDNPPPGTRSYALVMHDPEGRAPTGVEHMVIYGIPASVTHLAEGELSSPSPDFVGGRSTMNVGIYTGPGTPPNTDWHHYTLTIIATDLDPKALPPGLTHDELAKALGFGPTGHVKGSAGLIMRWRHPR